jgi:carboxypeptidase Q
MRRVIMRTARGGSVHVRVLLAGAILCASPPLRLSAQSTDADIARLVAALQGDTPMLRDAQVLTDIIGGRPTGSSANLRSIDWGLSRFQDAGVAADREAFMMPALWLEHAASAAIEGDGVRFSPRIASMPFSKGTLPGGFTARLVDGGLGTDADIQRAGSLLRGAIVLIGTAELKDVDGLFKEYAEATEIEQRAIAAGVAGLIYVGSRPDNLLYRHNASLGPKNQLPMAVMERDAGLKALRLLRVGAPLTITLKIDVESGGEYESYNVLGQIRGSVKPDEVIVIGAHLDSWDLGGGALDNGANVAMVIDIARQIKALGIKPSRTIRFALWNGEEQGMWGSWGYTRRHTPELERHVMTTSIDIGTGRINGFFTGARPELLPAVDQALAPVSGMGPFTQVDVPIVGTDNFDFMLEGVANLVANQDAANYGPNYHARSDEFARIDQPQLRRNAAIIAAMTLRFAEMPVTWTRQSRAQVERIFKTTDLEQQMRSMGNWDDWVSGKRGRLAKP